MTAVTTWVKLKFAALNLKEIVIHKWMFDFSFCIFSMFEAALLQCKVASLTG